MSDLKEAASNLEPAFITGCSESGRYFVQIQCKTMQEMHAWHDAVIKLAKASPKAII